MTFWTLKGWLHKIDATNFDLSASMIISFFTTKISYNPSFFLCRKAHTFFHMISILDFQDILWDKALLVSKLRYALRNPPNTGNLNLYTGSKNGRNSQHRLHRILLDLKSTFSRRKRSKIQIFHFSENHIVGIDL